jgi:hypothetical protein
LGQEIDRIRKVKTEREKKRLDPEHLDSLKKRKEELKASSDKEFFTVLKKNDK